MEHSPEAVYQRRWLILGVLCLSLVLVVVGNTSLNVALPSISRQLDASQTQLQWIVDAYAIVFAGLLLPAGALGDRFGRKGALQIGLVIFGAGTLAATVATTAAQVIACRAAMGVGAALVMPGTLSLLATAFPPHERPKAIAIWASFAGASGALGVLSSGVLLEHFWWGSVFFVNVPVVLLALGAGAVILPTSRDDRRIRLDIVGALFSVAAIATLVYAIIEGPVKGWFEGEILAFFVAAAVLIYGFIRWERRVADPMLDLTFFSNRRFSAGCAAIFVAFFAMFGTTFLISQYLQSVKGFSALGAGVAMLPMTVAMMIAAPTSAVTLRRFGQRRVVCAGLTAMGVGLLVVANVTAATPYLLFVAPMVVISLGMGQAMPPSTSAIMTSLPMHKAGVGSAVNDTTRELAGALGIAVLGSLMTSGYRNQLISSAPGGARLGVAQAVRIGSDGSAAGRALVASARTAFVSGMQVAMLVAGFVVLAGAVLAYLVLPRGGEMVATPERARAASATS